MAAAAAVAGLETARGLDPCPRAARACGSRARSAGAPRRAIKASEPI